jgi:hypothetical protein
MSAAARRISELEEERKALKEPLQEEWQQFVNAK